MTDEQDPMSPDDALRRSWLRLRRAHQHKQENPDVREWREIGTRNHFGPSFEAAVKAAMSRRKQ